MIQFLKELYTSEQSCVFLYEIQDDGKIIVKYSNPLNCAVVGMPDHYQDKDLFELLPRHHAVMIQARIMEVYEKQSVCQFILSALNGEKIYWKAILVPIHIGKTALVCGSACRMTDSFHPLGNAFINRGIFLEGDNSEDVTFMLQDRGEAGWFCTDINKRGQTVMDATREEICEKELSAIQQLEKEAVRWLIEQAADCIEKGQLTRNTIRHDFGGREMHWEITLVPIILDGIPSIYGRARDITARVQRRREREELLAEYQFIFRTTTSGVCFLRCCKSGEIEVERANDSFYRMMDGYQIGEEDTAVVLRKVFTSRQPITRQICITRGNTDYFYQICAVPIVRDGGKTLKLLLTCEESAPPVKLDGQIAAGLTKREKEILRLVIGGDKNRFIAYRLSVTEGTVKKMLSNIYRKLSVSSRAELIRLYLGRAGQDDK